MIQQNLFETCSSCYSINLSDCAEQITINAGLAPNRNYVYCLTDKFGNKYKHEAGTDSNGSFTINAGDLPPGLFMHWSGALALQVFPSMHSCEAESLTLCERSYNCVLIQFAKVQSEQDLSQAIIPCCNQVQPQPASDVKLEWISYDCESSKLQFGYMLNGIPQGNYDVSVNAGGTSFNTTIAVGDSNTGTDAVLINLPPGNYEVSIKVNGVLSNPYPLIIPVCEPVS